jgi:hypothetical protein
LSIVVVARVIVVVYFDACNHLLHRNSTGNNLKNFNILVKNYYHFETLT